MPSENPLVRRAVRTGGLLLAVAAAQFAAVMALVGSRSPGFDPWTTAVTAAANAPSPWSLLLDVSWIGLGLLGAVGLSLVWTAFDQRPSRPVGLLVLLLAAGSVAAIGILGAVGPRLPSVALRGAEYLAAVATGVGLIVVASAMHREERWHISRVYTLASGMVVLAGAGLYASRLSVGLPSGALEWIAVGAALLWAVVEGLHIARLHRFAPGLQVKIASA
jgi:hypothetical protein